MITKAIVSEILSKLTAVRYSPRTDERGNPTGMHLEFSNGLVVSIQWHSGAYSNVGRGFIEPGEEPTFESGAWFTTIEREGAYGPTTSWFSPERNREWHGWEDGDSVQPYQTLDAIVMLAHQCAFFGEGN